MAFVVDPEGNAFDAKSWGLLQPKILDLAERLRAFWRRFQPWFQTKTRDTSEYAYRYLSGLLRMETCRNFANVGRKTGVSEQNMQHFMSNSPWSAQALIVRIQDEIAATLALRNGGILILDESADEKFGNKTVGAARQYNGRLGKVEMSQVGTFLAYANLKGGPIPVWTWVDGELFIPEKWFSPEMAQERRRLGIPAERCFQTKIELGWQMIDRMERRGFPFEALCCDEFYGRSSPFRAQLRRRGIIYMADVPKDTTVYLQQPQVGIPQPVPGRRRGRRPSRPRILSPSVEVEQVANLQDTSWEVVCVRPVERGILGDMFAVRRVWTIWQNEPIEQWLVIRKFGDGRRSYSFSNADADASIERLAWLKCQRFFVEQANREAKSELGWDELEAQKYRAWEHHLAFSILGGWFIAETKLDWAREQPRDAGLAHQLGTGTLPNLSIANIRELLRAVMPLPQLSPEQAVSLVVKHLVNRTRSRTSRVKAQRRAFI